MPWASPALLATGDSFFVYPEELKSVYYPELERLIADCDRGSAAPDSVRVQLRPIDVVLPNGWT